MPARYFHRHKQAYSKAQVIKYENKGEELLYPTLRLAMQLP
jgi:hypothetical protein